MNEMMVAQEFQCQKVVMAHYLSEHSSKSDMKLADISQLEIGSSSTSTVIKRSFIDSSQLLSSMVCLKMRRRINATS
jgi:hypothetical protein